MTGAPPNDYGHAGEAQYNVESQEWLFTRRPGFTRQLQLVDGPVVTLRSDSLRVIYNTPESGCSRIRSTRELTSVYPEIAAAANFLSTEARVSEYVEKLQDLHAPLESDLLAFSHATDTDQHHSSSLKSVHLVAIPGGSLRDELIIVRLNNETLGWQEHEQLHLKSETLKNAERWSLQGPWGPIRQLRFSPLIQNKYIWLAVRFVRDTVLLHLVLRCNEDITSFTRSKINHGNSRADSNQPLTLTADRTGGSSHSDVAFNPFIANQFAVLDQQGSWSIWMLERRRRRRDLWELRPITSGHINRAYSDGGVMTDALTEGWGRINWIRDSKTIYVLSRTTFALFGLHKSGVRPLPVPSLIADGDF